MSATINCTEFADYFAIPVQNQMKPAYVFQVEGKPHSIDEFYLDDLEPVHSRRVGGRCCRCSNLHCSAWNWSGERVCRGLEIIVLARQFLGSSL